MKREKEIEAFLKGELPSEEKLNTSIARELGVLDQVIEEAGKVFPQKKPDGLVV